MWVIASRFQALGMNLSLSSDKVLNFFLIFFHIGEHFNTATCPFWGINLFLWASTSSKYSCDNPSPPEDTMVKKKHTLQNILKFQKVKFEYLHSYIWILIWIKIIDQFKMIAKMLWPLIQVLCNRCSILIKSRSCHNSTKKALWFFFYRDVTAFHQVPLTPRHHEKRWNPSTPYAWRNY